MLSKLLSRLSLYAELIRLNRPIGIYLLLWPTLWALWFSAQGLPPLKLLAIFIAGVVLMRSAGCAINDYADREFDKHVSRTRDRPLTAGKITEAETLGVFTTLCLIAFALVLFLNTKTILLSIIAALLAASYPFMKRFHHLPQVHLGVAFAIAIPMAYTAIHNGWPDTTTWLLFITAILWTIAYDTMYAMSDRDDDLKLGLKSTAILFGKHDIFIIGVLQLAVLILLTLIGIISERGMLYYIGLCTAAGFAIYQQFLINQRDAAQCLCAFLNNHWFGMAVFLGIITDYLFYSGNA